MSKSLKQYVDQYLEIIDKNPAENTIPPAWWVFNMWQKDENILSRKPEETVRIIEELKESDPLLAAVIQKGILWHAERNAQQLKLKENKEVSLFEIIRVGTQIELIPTRDARNAALALLEA